MKTLAWDNRDPHTGLASLFLFGEPLLSTIKATDCRTILAGSEHRESLYLFEHHLGMLYVFSWFLIFFSLLLINFGAT